MKHFASSTGLSDLSREPRRYLWTDAFAVCNYLELYRQTGSKEFLELALRLVTQVHQILGKHRNDSQFSGWLSGLNEEEAQQHPTQSGLRIGKKLNERQPDEPVDESLEWDQDGQYFHYLTKWMYALNCVSRVTGNSIYTLWAMELAKVAYHAFTYTPLSGGVKRMYWKMSIDLSRPLVSSMGHHDPLDGLITFQQLEATAKQFSLKVSLKTEIENMAAMCKEKDWATEDALGIGGLLTDAYKLVQLIDTHHIEETDRLESLLEDIEYSLQTYVTHNQLHLPSEYRLAFRELGLSIGLHTISRMQNRIEKHPSHFNNADQLISILSGLSDFYPISKLIDDFWSEPKHRLAHSWLDHEDINTVMLATSLAPESYLSCG
ncbi:hypothetical protein ACFLRS_01395 [Campylobacterota bacterium]